MAYKAYPIHNINAKYTRELKVSSDRPLVFQAERSLDNLRAQPS